MLAETSGAFSWNWEAVIAIFTIALAITTGGLAVATFLVARRTSKLAAQTAELARETRDLGATTGREVAALEQQVSTASQQVELAREQVNLSRMAYEGDFRPVIVDAWGAGIESSIIRAGLPRHTVGVSDGRDANDNLTTRATVHVQNQGRGIAFLMCATLDIRLKFDALPFVRTLPVGRDVTLGFAMRGPGGAVDAAQARAAGRFRVDVEYSDLGGKIWRSSLLAVYYESTDRWEIDDVEVVGPIGQVPATNA